MTWSHYYHDFAVNRADLIAFAWSAPMRDLAAKVGLSDNGLKKLLVSHGIPTPPQGHWNRVHAGKSVPSVPKAPARKPGASGLVRVPKAFADVMPPGTPIPAEGPFASKAVPEDLDELRAAELKALGRIAKATGLTRSHPAIRAVVERHQKRRDRDVERGWFVREMPFDNPVGKRELRILNGVLLALAKRDHAGLAEERDGILSATLRVGETSVSLTVDLAGQRRSTWRGDHRRPAADLPASTKLRLTASTYHPNLTTEWIDDIDGTLEMKIAAIAAECVVLGERAFREGLALAVREAEERRRRDEEAERARLARMQAERVGKLEESGELLRQATAIRALIVEVKSAMMKGTLEIGSDQLAAWESWASAHADTLDPVKSGQVREHLLPPE